MKRIFFSFILIVMQSIMLKATSTSEEAHDYQFERNGIYFRIFDEKSHKLMVVHNGNSYYWGINQDYTYNSYSGDVIIPNTVNYNGWTYRVTKIASYTFSGSVGLISITIPKNVVDVSNFHTFTGCDSLTRVTLNCNIETMLKNAYAGSGVDKPDCGMIFGRQIKEIVVGDINTRLADYAFCYLYNLESVILPVGLKEIGNYSFSSCWSLSMLSLPNGLTTIGNYSFASCTSLSMISFPDGLTSIGNYAFRGCTNLTTVSFPDGLTSIGFYAFSQCSNLTTVSFPDGLARIGFGAFGGCTNLTNISFPSSLTEIEGYAFAGISNLCKELCLNGIKNIGASAFENCTDIERVSCGPNLRTIRESAFYGCNKLKNIHIWALSPPYITGDICENPDNVTLYVPQNAIASYKSAKYWKEFTNILPIGDANVDGLVSISDLTALLNRLLRNEYNENCDINGDGKISISDMTRLVNIILDK